ncbi:RNA polymerase Rpb4 family protein [Haloquadratum walsbyi]|jgi:DNA-directed RNA polymerase subunit F|uniref:DNA-directed RNA polymerase subunit Rpo4 n=2 Tax=Haloquadratum walsbyi TaxID=293091 RepID=Q18G98_HALWD|nr:RNA polymerase Rpb4 family protein [Haloquadratum walsbyi]CAJ53002.1 DNA-directed RNA polymerase subunit F [Haloquadratum walsbyi DSM 16790]CCC41072.1 DNA-directed RNA polymerase subunit F [Haloquadratum walsbyi C23]
MTIFKEKLDDDYQTVSEVKLLLQNIEAERAAEADRDLRYELARAIEHVNRFADLDPSDSRELVDELLTEEKVDEPTAIKIADLLPQDRDELRAVFAQERYALNGDELDAILNTVKKYA